MTTQFQYTMRLTPVLDVQPTEGRNRAISKLMHYIPERISLENEDLELRCALLLTLPNVNLISLSSDLLLLFNHFAGCYYGILTLKIL